MKHNKIMNSKSQTTTYILYNHKFIMKHKVTKQQEDRDDTKYKFINAIVLLCIES